MPTLGFHLAITLLIVAVFMYLYRDKKFLKYIPIPIMMIFLGLFPDIDVFIGIHRATLHNIFIPIIPLAILGIGKVLKIKKIEKNQILFCLAAALLLIHIILDMSCGGIFIAYPLSDENFHIDASLALTEKMLIFPVAFLTSGNTNQTPNALDSSNKITNITDPPDIDNEITDDIGINFEYAKKGNTSEVRYALIPSKESPRIPIISNGVEMIFLITATLIYLVRFFSTKALKKD
jgi:membrane-bound metal-dependent hydrolase YbcI (DUF457 family)